MAFFRPQSIRDYLEIGRRLLLRKWLIASIAAVVTAAIGVLALRMPRTYTSTALILIEPGGLDPTRVATAVNVEGRLRNLRPMLTSRTTLENIIEELNLYPERRANEVMDKVVEHMRRYVQVKVSGRDSFQVRFTHTNPKTAQAVCDRLSRLLIERSVSEDLKAARERVDFLRKQVARLEQELKVQDDKILQFKREHIDEIGSGPEGVNPQASLAGELDTVSANLRAAQEREALLRVRLSEVRNDGAGGVDPAVRELERQEARQKEKLEQLQEVYTVQHPDVIKAKEELQRIRAELRRARQTAEKPGANPQVLNLRREIDQVGLEIRQLRREKERLTKELAEARARARLSPVVNAQLQELERERKRVTDELEKVGSQLKQAEYDAQVLENEKGDQFRIQDWANLPQAPDPPSRTLMLIVAGVLGLLAGVGVALVQVYFDQTVLNEYELSRVTDLPVLVSIPRYELSGPGSDPRET